jgi:signal transduction histidine kinase
MTETTERIASPDTATKVEATHDEAESVRRYDRQRRQRLLILLGAVFGVLIGVLFLVALVLIVALGRFGVTEIVQLGGIALNALLYLVVVILARRGYVEWSSALFAVGAGVAPNLNVLAATAAGGANPFNVVFLLGAIVIVSLAGRPWMVFGTALLSSLTTVYMVAFPPLSTATPAQLALHEYLVSAGSANIPVLFVVYWGMAILLLAQWRSYQRLLLELADVRTQVERARRLDELKDQFIRNVNHELRTPIMALLGYVDLLMNPDTRRSAEKVERYLQRAERAGQSLRALLAGILDTRRLGAAPGPLEPARLDLMTLLEDVIPLIPGDGEGQTPVERALRVRMTPGLAVWAEGIKAQQVFINLLGNAVKYSAPGAPVDIEARLVKDDQTAPRRWFQRATPSTAPQEPMVEIVVRDYGLGIPPESQPLLFQRFMRLPRDLESNVIGSGLGLYLSRTLVESMGGTIRVQSSGVPGEGSSFIVCLPALPATSEQAATPEEPDADPRESNLRLVAVRPADEAKAADEVDARQLSDQPSW